MINQNFLALDLELNNASDGSTPNPKIIQVGVAWGSYTDYKNDNLQTDVWYFDPEEPIFPEITQLTGITNEDIAENASTHAEVAQALERIIKSNSCFMNPITWGGGDSLELQQEFKARNINFTAFGRRWVDIKTFFVMHQLSKGLSVSGGLSKSMPKFGIHFIGKPHRAEIDAFNTLRLFFAMLERQNNLNQLLVQAKNIKV